VRAAALQALVGRPGLPSSTAIARALLDSSDRVRRRALELRRTTAVELPVATLMVLALSDPSATNRIQALQAIDQRSDAQRVAEMALYDIHPDVRSEAAAILARLRRTES
jgi:hypothetical protein